MGITSTEALLVFFGIFWATVIAGAARYRAFETHLLFRDDSARVWRRLGVGVVVLNVLPIVWLLVLLHLVRGEERDAWGVAAGAFGALSVFGFGRLLHAVLATDMWWLFYTRDEWKRVMEAWGRPGDRSGWALHAVPGVAWIATFSAVAWGLQQL